MSDDTTQPACTLEEALRAMTYAVEPGRFALCGFEDAPQAADLQALGDGPGQLVREGGETTLLMAEAELPEFLRRRPTARVERPLVWIRFDAPMGWEVVGFLAKLTGSLAAAGVPLGAVCGFSRDHLFLHETYLPSALDVLGALFPAAPPA